jgi:hypothetical protein
MLRCIIRKRVDIFEKLATRAAPAKKCEQVGGITIGTL